MTVSRPYGGDVSSTPGASDALAAQLQELVDEHRLRKLVHGYCRAVDRGDFDALRGMYHDDAHDAHGEFADGSPDVLIGHLRTARPHLRAMQHNVTTTNFAINGHAAEGEVYTIATHTVVAGDHDVDVVVGGRYLDKYEKRNDTWKFTARAIVTDWARVDDPSRMDLSHPITRGTPRGTLDESDPSHRFFALLGRPQFKF